MKVLLRDYKRVETERKYILIYNLIIYILLNEGNIHQLRTSTLAQFVKLYIGYEWVSRIKSFVTSMIKVTTDCELERHLYF